MNTQLTQPTTLCYVFSDDLKVDVHNLFRYLALRVKSISTQR